MSDLSFPEQLLDYLKTQLEFEEADIEAHKQLTNDEKVEQGILIRDAEVIDSHGNEYILRVEEDNSKVRVGDSVKIFFGNKRGTGRISDLGIDEITITTDIELPTAEAVSLEIMEFVFLQPMINLMESIVDASKPGLAFIDILEGIRPPKSRGLGVIPSPQWDALDNSFNDMQKEVIEQACLRPSVYCIQGPPGTGKTAVLSQIAQQFASLGKEVLVIANTHQAVNNALNKIASQHPSFNVVKIGETIQASQLFPNIFVNDTYSSYLKDRKNIKVAKHGDVVGMTLHAAVVNLGLRNSGFKPQVILVDEAGQIPMAYASLIGSFGCGSVIFIGDDKQMPPIFHPNLVGHPFSTSIFKYLCDKYPHLRKTLNVTYRMNDEIASIVSSCFYDDTEHKGVIQSSDYSANRRSDFSSLTGIIDARIDAALNSAESVVILNVTPSSPDGMECTDSNIYEANFLAEIAKIFGSNSIKPRDYAIITPYRRQVKLLRSLIGEDNAPLINTVECLQGQDVETILISFSASDPAYVRDQLEFLLNPNRLNVMISRAKTRVIVLASDAVQQHFFSRFPSISRNTEGLKVI